MFIAIVIQHLHAHKLDVGGINDEGEWLRYLVSRHLKRASHQPLFGREPMQIKPSQVRPCSKRGLKNLLRTQTDRQTDRGREKDRQERDNNNTEGERQTNNGSGGGGGAIKELE